MAFDEELADRLRALLSERPDVSEKRMFGGLAFLISGKLAVAASGQGGLMVRVPPDETEALLEKRGVEPFVMRGKPMDGWLRVSEDGYHSEVALREWVERSASYAETLA